jgi:hypothetical protein
MERDRIRRMLGGPPEAGLDTAEQWASSRDALLQNHAAAVFVDIGTPRAKADLAKMK